jgi:hypothetical protein
MFLIVFILFYLPNEGTIFQVKKQLEKSAAPINTVKSIAALFPSFIIIIEVEIKLIILAPTKCERFAITIPIKITFLLKIQNSFLKRSFISNGFTSF